jgi:5-methylcytosine-specific restriction endonuclease McrA
MAKVKRPRITDRMKVDCLLARVHMQFGAHLKCALSGEDMKPGDPVEFDHTHALVHQGGHSWEALRPVLREPHKKKSKRDVRDAAHVARLRGSKHKRRPKRQIHSSRFPTTSRPMETSRWKRAAAP